jgi:voltage-gated potassium channel
LEALMQDPPAHNSPDLNEERWELLEHIDRALDKPLIVLSFVWLALLILDLTQGLSPLLQNITYGIWALFILDFALGFIVAPHKFTYLQRNWLTAISLLLPTLRVLRVFRAIRLLRAARATRSINLIRVISSLNRGMRTIGATVGRRGVGYIVALTVIVTFAGAAGMYFFENTGALREAQIDAAGFRNYGDAVWWTAMIMTTMGSEYWPHTAEGRILGWLLALYAFAIFGYITATIASLFIAQDAATGQMQPASTGENAAETTALREEVMALREQIGLLVQQLETSPNIQPTITNHQPQTTQREQPR